MSILRSASKSLLYGPWRRRVANGQGVIDHVELRQLAFLTRSQGCLQIRTDHYQITGMATPPLFSALQGEHADPGSFLALLPNAELVGRNATAVWKGQVVLESVFGSLGYLLNHNDPRAILLRRLLPPQKRWTLALSLSNHLSNNYFHWVAETLPLLEALDQDTFLGMSMADCQLVINSPVPSFVWQWLEIFGIDFSQVRPWVYRRVKLEHLLVPSLRYSRLCDEHPHWGRHLYPRWALDFVRQRAFDFVARQPLVVYEPSRRIFLSRQQNGTGRGVVNHFQLSDYLQRHGYREVLAEKLLVREQIALFASITHLVAIHGAGMVNLIFSNQTRLIELFPANRHFGFTYQFLQISGHYCDQHHLLACPADPQQNMTVPLGLLGDLLSRIHGM